MEAVVKEDSLENEFECKLSEPGRTGLQDLAEVRRRQISDRNRKVGVIDDVERFGAELQLGFFSDVEVAVKRSVPIGVARADERAFDVTHSRD